MGRAMDFLGACEPLEEFGFYSEGDGKGSEPRNDSLTGFKGVILADENRLEGVGKARIRRLVRRPLCSNPWERW